MTTWLLISNNDFYRFDDWLLTHDVISWRQRSDFHQGDILYVYTTKPFARLTYKMVCIGANLPSSEYIDDEEYWTDKELYRTVVANFKRFSEFKLVERLPDISLLSFAELKKHGLKTVQSTHRMSKELLNYVESVLNSNTQNNDCEIDYPNKDDAFYEGAVTKVLANRYERNPKARQQCIEKLGCKCNVCGCDFSERYGELGEGFIHVHHIVPIGSIGKEYVLDPIKDLVPICPNCHYMLHRSNPPMKPEELKKLLHHD